MIFKQEMDWNQFSITWPFIHCIEFKMEGWSFEEEARFEGPYLLVVWTEGYVAKGDAANSETIL